MSRPTFNISSIFKAVLTTDKRYTLLTGGRASGKTFFLYALAAMRSYEHNVLFSRYTMESITTSVIPEVLAALEAMGFAEEFYAQATKLINVRTGNVIQFRGLKAGSLSQTARLKGLETYGTVMIDEAEEFNNEEAFDKLDGSIRRKGKNQIVLSMNPALRSHWIYERWLKDSLKTIGIDEINVEVSTSPDLLHIHTTFLDLPKGVVSESWVQATASLKASDPAKYAVDRIGQWRDIASGAIFTDWAQYRVEPEGGAVAFGLDLASHVGVTALVSARIIGNEVYLRQHYYAQDTKREQRIQAIRAACVARPWHRYKVATDHNDRDFTLDLQKALGSRVKLAKKADKEANIDKAKNLKIYIHRDSPDLLRQFAKFRRDERGKIVKEDDHAVDAALYAIAEAWAAGETTQTFYAAPSAGDRF